MISLAASPFFHKGSGLSRTSAEAGLAATRSLWKYPLLHALENARLRLQTLDPFFLVLLHTPAKSLVCSTPWPLAKARLTAAGGLSRTSAEAGLTLTQARGSDGGSRIDRIDGITRHMKSLHFDAHR